MSDLRDRYELGAGELDIDLRELDLPPGDTPLEIDLGIGDVRLAVPTDVCVATKADVGVGEVNVLGRTNEGVDVSFEEHPDAPPSVSRLVLDAEIGLGRSRYATRTTRRSASTARSRPRPRRSTATPTPTPPARCPPMA